MSSDEEKVRVFYKRESIRAAEPQKVYDLPKTFASCAILAARSMSAPLTSRRHSRTAIRGGARVLRPHQTQVRYVVAEIPITRKEKRNIWPMLLGILALVLVLGFLFGRRNADRPGLAADSTSSTTSTTSNGTVADTASRRP